MGKIVIEAEGLSRRFFIQKGRKQPYLALRDQAVEAFRNAWRRLTHPRSSEPTEEEFWALRDLSFSVTEGEAVAIIGRNGAGKSTLLKILSRVIDPTGGRVRMVGRVASLLEIGTGFHPELTGRENIFLNGAVLGMRKSEIRQRFDQIVDFAEVSRFLDTPVKRYSRGMYMRLAFSVAAHLEPEILIVDEVLAVGDAAFQKKCLGRMRDVASNEGRTVLFVSHNMSAVQTLCQRAIWLHDGRLQRDGPVDVVVNEYLSSHVEGISERKWQWPGDAPGDERVRLLRAGLRQNGRTTSLIDINRPMEVELDFEVLAPCKNLLSGCNFYDTAGTCLFANCDWRPNQLAPGRYRKRVEVPAQTFAEGGVNILVQLVFNDPINLSVILPDALSFEAMDTDSPAAVRGLYTGPWPGVLRLGLNWSDAAPLGE